MKKILFLDDDPERCRLAGNAAIEGGHSMTVVHTAEEAIQELSREDFPWDLIMLDHDLEDFHYAAIGYAGEARLERTGREVSRHLAEMEPAKLAGVQVVVHSWNPEGGRRMMQDLQDARIRCLRMEFGATLLKKLQGAL